MKTGVAPIKSPGRYSAVGTSSGGGLLSQPNVSTSQEQKSIFVGGMSKALMQTHSSIDDEVAQQSSENMSSLILSGAQKAAAIDKPKTGLGGRVNVVNFSMNRNKSSTAVPFTNMTNHKSFTTPLRPPADQLPRQTQQ